MGDELLHHHPSGWLLERERFDRRADCRNSLLGGEYIRPKSCNLRTPPHLDSQQHLSCIGRPSCNQLIVTDFQLSALSCDGSVEMNCQARCQVLAARSGWELNNARVNFLRQVESDLSIELRLEEAQRL